MNKRFLLLFAFCFLLLMTAGVLAESAAVPTAWQVIAGGGGLVRSSSYELTYTVGQPVSGSARSSDFTLGSGYWPGIVRSVLPIPETIIHLPVTLSPEN